MGTSNFCKVNAKKYYTVNSIEDRYDFERLTDNIDEESSFYGFRQHHNVYDPPAISNMRSYPSKLILSKQTEWKEVKIDKIISENFRVISAFHIIAGYYEGATLDYDIAIEDNYTSAIFLSEYYNQEEFIDDAIDKLFDYYRNSLNTELHNRESLRKALTRIVNLSIDDCEHICSLCCDDTFGSAATFSNGESIYFK